MFERLLDLLRSGPAETDAAIDPALAAGALMFEVVWADHDIGRDEIVSMIHLLQDLFDLNDPQVEAIVAQTKINHDSSVGVFPFTQVLNDQLSVEEKFGVIRAMWIIALADEKVDAFEEHTIRRIADLLYVPHSKFIEAKLSARQIKSGRPSS